MGLVRSPFSLLCPTLTVPPELQVLLFASFPVYAPCLTDSKERAVIHLACVSSLNCGLPQDGDHAMSMSTLASTGTVL